MTKTMKRGKKLPSKSMSASSSNPDRKASAKATRSGGSLRDKATINRLNMYRGSRVVRNVAGKVVGGELLDRNMAGGKEINGQSGRIAPDRRWFGNTRTIGQTELDKFREEMRTVVANPYQVVLHRKKVPVGLVKDEALVDDAGTKKAAEKTRAKAKRRELLEHEPFAATFSGSSSGTHSRKRPKLSSQENSLEALAARAKQKREAYDSNANTELRSLAAASKDSRALESEQLRDLDGTREERSHDLFAKGQSRRIWAELYKVLDCSDVVLHVLDARDVPGTRCERVIQHLKSKIGAKHLVFVLNKCDLVPNWIVKRWLSILAKTAPTIAFRASRTKPFGKSAVLDILKQFAKLKRDAKQISVGIVGAPNVGKSSLINALRNKDVCKVAPIPGETKIWQYVTLTKRVNLIDSPGVVYDKDKGNNEADAVLRGIVRAERLPDPDIFIPHLLLRCHDLDHIHNTYGHGLLPLTPERHQAAKLNPDPNAAAHDLEDDAALFLKNLAHKCGRLLPGGEPDSTTVAKMLINDWQRGKVPHFVPPPNLDDQEDDALPQEEEDQAVTAEDTAAAPPEEDEKVPED